MQRRLQLKALSLSDAGSTGWSYPQKEFLIRNNRFKGDAYMRTRMLAVLLPLFLLGCAKQPLAEQPAVSQETGKGDQFVVQHWAWVDIKNDAIKNGSYGWGESCVIQTGGTITVVSVEHGQLHLQYSTVGTHADNSVACPDGVVFIVQKGKLKSEALKRKSR